MASGPVVLTLPSSTVPGRNLPSLRYRYSQLSSVLRTHSSCLFRGTSGRPVAASHCSTSAVVFSSSVWPILRLPARIPRRCTCLGRPRSALRQCSPSWPHSRLLQSCWFVRLRRTHDCAAMWPRVVSSWCWRDLPRLRNGRRSLLGSFADYRLRLPKNPDVLFLSGPVQL